MGLDKVPELARVSEPEQDALMAALWAELPRLKAQRAALEATSHEPRTDAHHARVPPAQTPKANLASGPRTKPRRAASGGRAGGGRPLHPDPDHVIIAQATICPQGGGAVRAHEPHPPAVYDTIEWPPVQPMITRVEQPGGPGPPGGQPAVAPVPVGRESGTPVGPSSDGLATALRSPQAIRAARLSARLAQGSGVPSRAGALAQLFRRVQRRRDERVAELLTRLRRSRLSGRDETGARVNRHTPWAWVCQTTAVCVPVIRPSRGPGVIHASLGEPRPTIWGAALSRAQQNQPAEPWQVCWAHQWRDGQGAVAAGDTVVAPRLQAVLRRAWAMHKRRDTLVASPLEQYRGARQRRVDRGLASPPAQAPGRRLQKRSAKLQDHVCRLRDEATMPPPNHSRAQAMRLSTVFRNVTNGFRSAGGRDRLAAVRAVVNTGKRHGLSAFQAIQKALSPMRSLFDPGCAITKRGR